MEVKFITKVEKLVTKEISRREAKDQNPPLKSLIDNNNVEINRASSTGDNMKISTVVESDEATEKEFDGELDPINDDEIDEMLSDKPERLGYNNSILGERLKQDQQKYPPTKPPENKT